MRTGHHSTVRPERNKGTGRKRGARNPCLDVARDEPRGAGRDHAQAGFTLVEGDVRPAIEEFPAAHAEHRSRALRDLDEAGDVLERMLNVETDQTRAGDLNRARLGVRLTRLTIAGNGFEMGGEA